MKFPGCVLVVVLAVALVGCSTLSAPTPTSPPATANQPSMTSTASAPTASPPSLASAVTNTPATSAAPATETAGPAASAAPAADTATPPIAVANPFDLISQESLLAFLQDLTAFQPYSGWRNSGSEGEAEALDYVAQELDKLAYLTGLGLELERQSFHVFLATELWETDLLLTIEGRQIEVPADGLRGPRDDAARALRYDSDGMLDDAARNPVVVEGPVVVLRSADGVEDLSPDDARDKIVFLDYAVIDRSVMQMNSAVETASTLLEKEPAGLILVTEFSNEPGVSHGAFVGDASALDGVAAATAPPTLYVRLEDLTTAGIEDWDDLGQIQAAQLTWDADVFSPGTSQNLIARIPGAEPSQAIILGAHIDSPNAPGAMDDGSGSAILLEVARVLDGAQRQPPNDLFLVWFGSEELGLYGASNFVATHQELLDRTIAMLQIDCLTRPLDGLSADLRLVTWPYGRLGDDRLRWPMALSQAAVQEGIQTVPQAYYGVYSDNNTFGGFDVPHADLIFEPKVGPNDSVHYAGHIHDPYDTVDLAREVGDVLEEMSRVALTAALTSGQPVDSLRVTLRPDRRAVFVASHTEVVHMSPITFAELGMALSMAGFDVDLIPYGEAVTSSDLGDADLVVVLPVVDYPGAERDPEPYDESWTESEIAALETYADQGGLLVLSNSAHRLKYGNRGLDRNEDWEEVNALAAQLGVTYRSGIVPGSEAITEGDHPLIQGLERLELGLDNGIPFSLADETRAQILAQAGGEWAVALVDFGDSGGQVLVLADVGILTTAWGEPKNLPFWQNLAQYARTR